MFDTHHKPDAFRLLGKPISSGYLAVPVIGPCHHTK